MTQIHPLIIYAVFGMLFSVPLVILWSRLAAQRLGPVWQARLWLVPLLLPFVIYGISLFFQINRNCVLVAGTNGISGWLAQLQNWLCQTGSALAVILTPLFFLAFCIGVIKAVAALILNRRLVERNGYLQEDYRGILTLTTELAGAAGIKPPPVVLTDLPLGQAFVSGFWRPVLIFSRPLLETLDEEELAAVLAHEIGHCRRGDNRLTWLLVLLRDLLLFTGLSPLVFASWEQFKERLTDREAAELGASPLALAQALLKSRKLSLPPGGWRLALDNFLPLSRLGGKGKLQVRVEALLAEPHGDGHAGWGLLALGSVVVLTGGLLFYFC